MISKTTVRILIFLISIKSFSFNLKANNSTLNESFSQTERSNEGMWLASNRDQGSKGSSAQGVQIFAKEGVNINAKEIKVDVQDSLREISSQEGFEYLGDLANDSRVDWNEIQSAYESWDKKSTHLTQAGAMLVTIAVAIATGPGAAGIAGAAGGGAAGAAAGAGFSAVVAQAAVSVINNGGDLGAVFKELASSDSLRSLAVTMATAGAVQGLGSYAKFGEYNSEVLGSAAKAGSTAVIRSGAESLLNKASFVNSLMDNLESAGIGLAGELAAGEIGSTYREGDINYLTHKVAHAALGCAMGAASGGNCASGAIGGALGEIIAEGFGENELRKLRESDELKQAKSDVEYLVNVKGYSPEEAVSRVATQYSQPIAGMSTNVARAGAILIAGFLGEDPEIADLAARNAAENNFAIGFQGEIAAMLFRGYSDQGTAVLSVDLNPFSDTFLKTESGILETKTIRHGIGGGISAGTSWFLAFGNDDIDDLAGESAGTSFGVGYMTDSISMGASISSDYSVFTTSFSLPVPHPYFRFLGPPSYGFEAYGAIDANETSVVQRTTWGEGYNLFDFDDKEKDRNNEKK